MFAKCLLTAALMVASQPALAQQLPSAGSQLQQIPPTSAPQKAAPAVRIERSASASEPVAGGATAVSYTHLTLPTKRIV